VTPPLVVVGDALLDRDLEGAVERLCPDAPVPVVDEPRERARPGGAGLAALLAAGDRREVVLVTALARDEAGRELGGLLRGAGVQVHDLGLAGATPEKVRIIGAGRPIARMDRGGAPGTVGPLGARTRRLLAGAAAVLVADYGRGVPAADGMRDALRAAAARRPLVWDPHPRGARPVPGARLATPNAAEAARFAPDEGGGDGLRPTAARAAALRARWRAEGVAVTLGQRGALLAARDGVPLLVAAPPARGGDPCGAGDRFAATAAGVLAGGGTPAEAVEAAVGAASAFVAEGGARALGAAPDPPAAGGAEAVIAQTRARGGVVVATGGCFDLLHAGHVRTLEAARALGDCLVVLVNSDASVRRLKGPDRPLVEQDDRAAVLAALGCVDAVEIFHEDTPVAALERLRPDVFAKGSEYALEELPEAAALATWGGQAVLVPYVAGRSTTRLIEEVMARAG
jgi:D-beta-D-heptose 7-phosphate kinase / D-beta-D-heptose 1-phosphate adenosyltransferase